MTRLPKDPTWFPLHRWSWLGRRAWTRWLLRPLPGSRGERPYVIRLDDEGIHELYAARREVRYPWSAVERVRHSDRHVVMLRVSGGTVRWQVDDAWRYALLAAIHERLQPEPEPDTVLAPEQMAAWLGIPVDGRLIVKNARNQREMRGFVLLSLVLITPSLLKGSAPLAEIGTLLTLYALWKLSRSLPFDNLIAATATGLHVGQAFVPWSDVTRTWNETITTRVGEAFWVHGDEAAAQRVMEAVRKLIEARQAGAVLPRMTNVPDHAISRAESVDVSAERGISPVEDGPA